MASEPEKLAYLEEHVSYEVVMLNYTFYAPPDVAALDP